MCSSENDRLADEITELASHIHAATCRWLGLVAEFERRQGWGEWGCRSCAHWLSWRCSISPAAAREHVRVALRLQELPLIREAFGQGRLSYSQVRALSRVETVAREEELLSLARHATAAQLERLVRAYRGVVARARAAGDGGPERYLTWDHADDGSLLLHARLPAEEGAVVLAALQAAVERLADGASGEAPALDPAEAARSSPVPRRRLRSEPLPRKRARSSPLPRKRRRLSPLPRKRCRLSPLPRKHRPSARFRGSASAGRAARRRSGVDGRHPAGTRAQRARR